MRERWTRDAVPRAPSFLYAQTGKLRAIWRLLAFGAMIVLAYGLVSAIVSPVLGFANGMLGDTLSTYSLLELATTLAAIAVMLNLIEHAPWSDVALDRDAWRLGTVSKGAAIGAAAIATVALMLVAVGGLHFSTVNQSVLLGGSLPSDSPLMLWLTTALRLALLLAPAALTEELIFRGYLWRVAQDAAGPKTALWTTSIAFGLVHMANPGASIRTIGTVILAGLWLGEIRRRTGSLPAAWTAHFAWNWIMAAVLHVPVSGLPLSSPVYSAEPAGPAWISGGSWGPEGGAVAALVLTSSLLFVARKDIARFTLRFGSRHSERPVAHQERQTPREVHAPQEN